MWALVRVTADTNIYISALQFGGAPLLFLNLARDGKIILSVSPAILEEVAEVLRDKFRRTGEDISGTISQISRMTQLVIPLEHIDIVKDDPDDNSILECAQTAGSQFIVSGDKHLLSLKRFGQIPILKLSDFLHEFDVISSQSSSH